MPKGQAVQENKRAPQIEIVRAQGGRLERR